MYVQWICFLGTRTRSFEATSALFRDVLGERAHEWVSELGEADAERFARGHRGREIDTAGDGFFASFDGPARAIRCARAISDDLSEFGVPIRAGIHTGECETTDGKVAGIAVAIGARVAGLATPDEVLVSMTVAATL